MTLGYRPPVPQPVAPRGRTYLHIPWCVIKFSDFLGVRRRAGQALSGRGHMQIPNAIVEWVSILKSRAKLLELVVTSHLRRSCGYAGLILLASISVASPALGQVSVLTGQYDNARTTANLNETILNTSNVNVNQFGLLYSRSLDGSLYAQPLYVPSVVIPGQGTHNVIYLATLHNTVVAFDADTPSQAAPLWQVNLGPSRPCCFGGFITPEMGILSTPVIDTSTSTLYVVAATLQNGSYSHWLHALNITNGQEKFGGPVSITATVPGSGYDNVGGRVTFNSGNILQRSALLLGNGTVYIAFASIDDADFWHGWLLGYNAANIQQQVFVYNSTADGQRGGIWQSGRGPVLDANGNIYFMTGNGDYDGANDFGDSMVKLNSSAVVQDWFTPDDQATLASEDADLGSSGPVFIPNTNLLVGGGKQGILYLINSATGSMGKFSSGNTRNPQSFQASSGEIHSVAYWNRSGSPLLYLWGKGDVLKAFQFGGATFGTTPAAENVLHANFPGGILAVSANGSTAGSGILWAETPNSDSSGGIVAGTLRAYDAANVSEELWDSTQNSARDTLGNFAKFTSPTIDNGHVYAPTFSNQIDVYGLLGASTGVSIWLGPASVTLSANGQQQQFSATIAGTSNTAVTWSMSPSLGTLSANGLYTAPYPGIVTTTQTVTITATSQADTTKSATATVTINPATSTGTAAFVHLDTTTQGNWHGVYGADGYNVINATVAYPSYVTVTPSGTSSATWASSTTDVRALYTSATSTTRIATAWDNTTSFLVDMVFSDGRQHQVAFYFLDWDTTARSETVLIQDANGLQLSPTQTVSNFHNGQYLVYVLSGHVQMRVSDLNPSANVVLSGLFFGTPGTATTYTFTGPSGGVLNAASSNFTVTPNGSYNGSVTVTPSGGGLSTPVVLTFSNSAAPQTFTITPTAVGPVTLTPNSSTTLTDASALTYATPPGAPTIGTATAGNGQATVSFTAPTSTGGSAITSYKATCGSQSVSGTASPITVTGLSNGTSYTCTVTASNAQGVSAPSAASNSVTPSSAGTTTGTATFTTLDTTTQGNWQGVYGSNGYNVINGTVAYPSYVTVTPSGQSTANWTSSTTDVRALYTSATSTTRIAAAWYNPTTTFLIDLVFNDGNQHQLALYCLDWDTTKRAETVTIQDANGVLLNTQNMTNFHNGDYLVWQLSGHVQILVTSKNSSANAVVSGLFFGTPGAATTYTFTGPSGGALNTASSNFTVTPNGSYNGSITVTPSGGGLSTPIVLTYSNSAAPQTFTITPTAAGPVTLTPNSSTTLTDASALTYATPPGAPTIGTATAGNAQATVSFTAPASTGGSAITGYTATCVSQSVSGTASPITVTGLSNGTSYTCTATATNAFGISAPSAASNSVTPSAVAGYTFTGPTGGALNTASSNFTVTPNGTYNGTITITP